MTMSTPATVSESTWLLVMSLKALGIDPADHVATIRADVARVRRSRVACCPKTLKAMEDNADSIEAALKESATC
jgi:hypothetical protein